MSSAWHAAVALEREGRFTQAFELYERAIREDPLDPERWWAAAKAAVLALRPQAALPLLEFYLKMRPDSGEAYYVLANVQLRLAQCERALASLSRAAALGGGDPARLAIGEAYAHAGLGRFDDATRAFRTAVDAPAVDPGTRYQQAVARILLGDFQRGWREFEEAEWTFRITRRYLPDWQRDPARRWRGELLPEATLCVYESGGHGDALLFARFLPDVAARVGRVVLRPKPALNRLLASVPGVAGIASDDELADPAVRVVNSWSLPALLGASPESIAALVPYLVAPVDGPRLPPRRPGAVVRAGIVWAGSPNTLTDGMRSAPHLDRLVGLLGVPGVEWISLQVGPRASEAEGYPIAAAPPFRDFADTAAVVSQLDVVVSVDTAVANLAGAMGVPLWVSPSSVPDFRWVGEGARTPWFPTARVFRRGHFDDWTGVVRDMTAALDELVTRRRSGEDAPDSGSTA